MKCSLDISNFLKRSLVFPILFFSSICLRYSLKKAFLSLLAILWIFTFSWVYLSLFSLPFTSLLSSTICKAASDNHFAFLHFFFFGDGFGHCLLYHPTCHNERSCVPQLRPGGRETKKERKKRKTSSSLSRERLLRREPHPFQVPFLG